MVNIDIKLTGDVLEGLHKYESKIKQQVLFSGVAAMALLVYEEVQINASKHVVTGTLLASVYRAYSPEKSDDERKVYNVSVNKRTAPHWHFLEYGTSRQRAQPFIRPAFVRVDEAIRKGMQRMAERLEEIT